jgi:predicted nucleotidyltransferase
MRSGMDRRVEGFDLGAIRAALRSAGARFAFLHGSRVSASARTDSDLDVAAWFAGDVAPWEVPLPSGVDLLTLNHAPMELAGRIALHGELLFDDDPPARVRWQADTRLRYLDERSRQEMVNRTFKESHARGR